MEAKRVNILLSTYNGEKYVKAQLDSLLAQTYSNIHIYIRDDGSKDQTNSIIEQYEKEYDRITVLNKGSHENLGYMGSFWKLLKECDKADYYSFCDQDDAWESDKVKHGVEMMQKESDTIPVLYSSYFAYCDDALQITGYPPKMSKRNITLKDVMFYTPAFGFTVMVNECLRKMAINGIDLTDIPHDGWCQKIAASQGKFLFGNDVDVRYRRHCATVTHADSNVKKMLVDWFCNELLGDGLGDFYFVIKRLNEEYGSCLNAEDQELLHLFQNRAHSVKDYFKRLFYPKRFRPTWGGEMALRICFLFNK